MAALVLLLVAIISLQFKDNGKISKVINMHLGCISFPEHFAVLIFLWTNFLLKILHSSYL